MYAHNEKGHKVFFYNLLMRSCKRDKQKHNSTLFYQPYKTNDKHRNEIKCFTSQCFLSVRIQDFEIQNVSFTDTNQNKVINGTFSNIIYTDSNVIFNGVFILLPSFYCSSKLISIEYLVIELYREFCVSFKEPKFLIKEYFEDAEQARIFGNDCIFKISGIWETDTHYGINYKFIQRR
jgi:hypothetical protein